MFSALVPTTGNNGSSSDDASRFVKILHFVNSHKTQLGWSLVPLFSYFGIRYGWNLALQYFKNRSKQLRNQKIDFIISKMEKRMAINDEDSFVDSLLDAVNELFYPTFGIEGRLVDGMSNHMAMALLALYKLRQINESNHQTIDLQFLLKFMEMSHEKLELQDASLPSCKQTDLIVQWEKKHLVSWKNVNSSTVQSFNELFTSIFTRNPSYNRSDFLFYYRLASHLVYLHAALVKITDENDESLKLVNSLNAYIVAPHLSQKVLVSLMSDPIFKTLIGGLSGGAFHPIIMLAYGILHKNHRSTITSALAYFMYGYQSLEIDIQQDSEQQIMLPTTQVDIFQFFQHVESTYPEWFTDKFRQKVVTSFLIFQIMKNVSQLLPKEEYAAMCSFFKNENKSRYSLEDMAELSLNLYLYGPSKLDIVTLHSMTACFAVRVVREKVENQDFRDELLYQLWICLLNLYVVVGGSSVLRKQIHRHNMQTSTCEIDVTWNEIFNQLKNNFEEHDIKLVYTCYEESQQYPRLSSLFRKCAAKRVGLYHPDETNQHEKP